MNGVSALLRRHMGEVISLSLSLPCEDSQKNDGLKTRERELSPEPSQAGIRISDFRAPKTLGNVFLLVKPPGCGICYSSRGD